MKKNVCYIYALLDPRTEHVRYVGKTNDTRMRMYGHLSAALHHKDNTHRYKWISSLLKQGLKPKVEVLEETTERDWPEREKWWIKSFRMAGERLTNTTDGGEGTVGVRDTPERREKRTVAARELWKRPDHWEKMKPFFDSRKGKPQSPEEIRKRTIGLRNLYSSPKGEETRRKMSASQKGHPVSEQTRKKVSESLKAAYLAGLPNPRKGVRLSSKIRQKISEARKQFYIKGGKHPRLSIAHTAETKKKISRASRRYFDNLSPEERLKMVAHLRRAQEVRWEKHRTAESRET